MNNNNKYKLLYISDTEESNSDHDVPKINNYHIKSIKKKEMETKDVKKEMETKDINKEMETKDIKKEMETKDINKEMETKDVKKEMETKDIKKEEIVYNDLNDEYEVDEYEENKYNKIFIEPIILDNINLYYYFDKNDIAYVEKYKKTNLKITDKGLYSISKPLDAQWITDQITKEYSYLKINTIIDGTAGIGGNVISFAKYFKNVVGIELNKVHYQVLKENIQLLDLKNVRLYHDNILTYYEHIQEREKSIFFIDPPWGGRKYKNFKNFVLKIGKYYIYEFIELLYKNGFKHIVLKAPLNLNVNLVVQNVSFKNIKIIKHINMMLLMIS